MQTSKFAKFIDESGPNLVMTAGVICLLIALFFPVPGDHLTTYKSLSNEPGYSYVEEYVGGDAYNYITGAALVGGHIAGAMATKSIFAVGGLVLLAMGIGQTNARKTVSQQNEVAGKHAEGTTSKQPETADQRTATEQTGPCPEKTSDPADDAKRTLPSEGAAPSPSSNKIMTE